MGADGDSAAVGNQPQTAESRQLRWGMMCVCDDKINGFSTWVLFIPPHPFVAALTPPCIAHPSCDNAKKANDDDGGDDDDDYVGAMAVVTATPRSLARSPVFWGMKNRLFYDE